MPDLSMFGNSATVRRYPQGHCFFSRGDVGDVMYIVLSGEVEIAIRERVIETVGPGGIFGEMAVVDNRERSAGAIAKTAVEVATIDQSQFLYLVSTHPLFSIEVMHVMTERIRLLNEAVH